MRTAEVKRKTNETDISLELSLEGEGNIDVETGCGFLNHMLELFAAHGGFDLRLSCVGDTKVDDHHTVEDVGITLGKAFLEAVGDKKGIYRYGTMTLPMDEVLILCSLDLSGRSYLNMDVSIPSQKVGSFDTELVSEFMMAMVRGLEMNLHFILLSGGNSHHIIEAMFKAFGRALAKAVDFDPKNKNNIPSTKGLL